MRYFLKLAYNGENYCGWQIQPNAVTVQETLNNALSLLLKEDINLVGAGRTDTGVHARVFYAHFDTESKYSEQERNQLIDRINSFLPQDIVIYEFFPVKADFHARFNAVSRTYRYYITTEKKPFHTKFSHRIFYSLDIEKMNIVCEKLLLYKDFTSFSKVHTQTATNHCRVTHAHWFFENELLVFEITADRFLRNMVRSIVGTMLEVGRGKMTIEEFCSIIEQKDRSLAGVSVPAHALFLEGIEYLSEPRFS
jgi:tRNA pseudouridine38-40 synthase